MSPIDRREPAFTLGVVLLLLLFAFGQHDVPAQHRSQTKPADAGSTKTPLAHPTVRKNAQGPVRIAVATVAVQTSVFVQAYDRFLTQYGKDKLQLDLLVEQEWAESPRVLDFQQYDVVLALRCSIPGLETALAESAKSGTWVIADSSIRHAKYAQLIDDLPSLQPYYRHRGVSNMVGLFEQICKLYDVPGVTPRSAEEPPVQGLFHPDADHVFTSGKDYWKWYEQTPNFKPDAPRIGVLVYNTLFLNEETDYFAEVIRSIEQAGANPVLGFWFVSVGRDKEHPTPLLDYFGGVDVLMSSSFRLMMEKSAHYAALKTLNVPVLNSIILNETAAEWRDSRQGITPTYLLPGIVTPELAGLIEPTVVAARQRVKNELTGHDYYRTVVIPENLNWQIRRAIAWAKLRKTTADQRRVAILYYNHGTGKQNIGASYLNVTASLERILHDLQHRGYAVADKTPTREEVLSSIQTLGRNVGNWAPAEIDRLVEQGAVLWPLEKYLAHYDRLPQYVKNQITKQWGQPPGDVMTFTRDGRKYFVLPAFQLGNVVVGPQPSRGASESQYTLYHDPHTWPTHQYLAFYFWLRYEWQAHAVVHLGRHGTLEFLPGKSIGLATTDPPAVVLGDLPNIYPYIVDGIGEAVAAKRRGQAVLLTHATPPLTKTTLYKDLAQLQELVNRYIHARDQRQSGLQHEYYHSIVEAAGKLGYLQLTPADFAADTNTAAVDEQVQTIAHWLEQIEAQVAPRGLHTFGEAYDAPEVMNMLPRMFQDEFARVKQSSGDGRSAEDWLKATSESAAETPPETRKDDADRSLIETTAWEMRHNRELDYLAAALRGEFIEVGPPGDPLSNPSIFPTGRNQYQYNPDKLPTQQAWEVGQRMAEQTIELHRQQHGAFPKKLSVTLWANTMIRTDGVLESEVLHLLGVEPVWNSRGDVEDIRLVAPLGRPRIDVVMTVTGMYRDSFPEKILLLDRAIQLAYEAVDEAALPNYVRLNSDTLVGKLVGAGASEAEALKLAKLRIFGAPTGQYGTGVHHFVNATQQWTQTGEVADQYMERMSNAFSRDGWSRPVKKVFQQQLSGVQAVIHGRSSNLYGVMDLTENFEYQGALALSVEQLDGKQPDIYINDLVSRNEVLSGRQAIVLELLSRYHNPDFILSMQQEGFDGAKYFSRIADNQFGWDVVSDVITAEDWKNYAEIYVEDRYDLGLKEFFDQHNPHALQNIASRILEVDRKQLQELDEETLQAAAQAYVESIAKHGPACASHICANPELAEFAESLALASGEVAQADIRKFRQQLQGTGNERIAKSTMAAGASTELATAPQPVVGQVLTPPEPVPAADDSANAQPHAKQPPDQPDQHENEQPPSPNEQTPVGKPLPLAPGIILLCCVVIFAGGFAWRMHGTKI